VVGLEADHIRVKMHKGDNVVMVGKETWYKLKYTYNQQSKKIEQEQIGTFQQLPVALGWAITIHKSQGITLEHLTLDLGGGTFASGQLYVALSRAKSIEGITLAKPIAMRDCES
jgi:ATP-dependent DNA helicase PIF1